MSSDRRLAAINGALRRISKVPDAAILCNIYFPKSAPGNIYGKFDESQEIEESPRFTEKYIFLNHVGASVTEANLFYYLDNQLVLLTSVSVKLPYGAVVEVVSNKDLKFRIHKDEDFSRLTQSLIVKYKLVPFYSQREELDYSVYETGSDLTLEELEVVELNKPRENFNVEKTTTVQKPSVFGNITISDSKDR